VGTSRGCRWTADLPAVGDWVIEGGARPARWAVMLKAHQPPVVDGVAGAETLLAPTVHPWNPEAPNRSTFGAAMVAAIPPAYRRPAG